MHDEFIVTPIAHAEDCRNPAPYQEGWKWRHLWNVALANTSMSHGTIRVRKETDSNWQLYYMEWLKSQIYKNIERWTYFEKDSYWLFVDDLQHPHA